MANRTLQITDPLYDYYLDNYVSEIDALRELREVTSEIEEAMMQIAPEQGRFLTFLVELIEARNTLEIGVFTGYSSICTALGLPADGKVFAFDVSEKWTLIAREHWKKAGVDHKINLTLGPATDSLQKLITEGKKEDFDFAFIDADKINYRKYYELVLQLLKSGGLIVIDNVLWGGKIADAESQDSETKAIREINRTVFEDSRVKASLIPVGDGLLLAKKI